MEDEVSGLYAQLLTAWNDRDARRFAALFTADGQMVGFDGSQVESPAEIATHLAEVFGNHPTARYVWKIRGVQALGPDVALLRATVGMIPPGQQQLNPAVNAIQSQVATRQGNEWRIALLQTTPAQFHGRPDLAEALTAELSALIPK